MEYGVVISDFDSRSEVRPLPSPSKELKTRIKEKHIVANSTYCSLSFPPPLRCGHPVNKEACDCSGS